MKDGKDRMRMRKWMNGQEGLAWHSEGVWAWKTGKEIHHQELRLQQ